MFSPVITDGIGHPCPNPTLTKNTYECNVLQGGHALVASGLVDAQIAPAITQDEHGAFYLDLVAHDRINAVSGSDGDRAGNRLLQLTTMSRLISS